VDRKHFLERYGSAVQAIGATLAVLIVVGGFALRQHDAYADERYVLKGELLETLEALGKTLNERDGAKEKKDIEAAIVDLEDDIIWFSENDNMPSAKRRCSKLTRAVREWNEISTPVIWVSDRVVQGVCDQ
jgi:hypothetical protein